MSLTFQALLTANFDQLNDTVTRWRNLPGQLRTISSNFDQQVSNRLHQSNWIGETADAAFTNFKKVDREMKRGEEEGRRVHRLLEGALRQFQSSKKILKETKDRIDESRHLKISSSGEVSLDLEEDSSRQSILQRDYADTIRSYNERIRKALNDATSVDDALRWALLNDENGESKTFNSGAPETIEEAKKGLDLAEKDADAIVKLASKEPVNDEVAEELNKRLKRIEGDRYANERFVTKLGPDGLYKFWSKATTGPNGVTAERGKVLQKQLGLSLADASHSDSEKMKDWKKGILETADRKVSPDGNGPVGFQVVSNVMRHGEFEKEFLRDYGDELIKYDKAGMGPIKWAYMETGTYNFGDKGDLGSDPMTGFMEGLENHPKASLEFFDADDNKNLNYLLGDRHWPQDATKDDAPVAGHRAAIAAIESATTGPPRSSEQAKIVEELVRGFAENDPTFEMREGMQGGLGRISAEFMPDINRALHGGEGSADETYPFNGPKSALADLDEQNTVRFLYDISRDPEGNAAVLYGKEMYAAEAMVYHMNEINNPEFEPANKAEYQELKASREAYIERIANQSGQMQAISASARADEIGAGYEKTEPLYYKALQEAEPWANSTIGVGVGIMTTPIAGIAAPIIGAAAGTASEQIIEKLLAAYEPEGTDEASKNYAEGTAWQNGTKGVSDTALESAKNAGEFTGESHKSIEIAAESAARDGVTSGNDKVNTYVHK